MGVENHKAKLVRIGEIQKHPNADTLGLIQIEGYQVVVKLGEYNTGDLAIYIQPDSVVPEAPQFSFLWPDVPESNEVPIRKRRITVRRFRKQYSEGLLMPVSVFPDELCTEAWSRLEEGDDIAELIGVTHWDDYQEDDPVLRTAKRKRPDTLLGWVKYYYWSVVNYFRPDPRKSGENEPAPQVAPPVYDVEAYKNFVGAFTPEDVVVATEKIHGANGRFVFDGKRMYAGSRKLWKAQGYENIWRKTLEHNPWIELWCKSHTNYTLYGEVVPAQGGFDYGYRAGAIGLFVFDIRTPDGNWVSNDEARRNTGNQLQWVPLLYQGLFVESKLKELAEGRSTVAGATHVREGLVIKLATEQPERIVRGLGRLQLKIVGNGYYEKS